MFECNPFSTKFKRKENYWKIKLPKKNILNGHLHAVVVLKVMNNLIFASVWRKAKTHLKTGMFNLNLTFSFPSLFLMLIFCKLCYNYKYFYMSRLTLIAGLYLYILVYVHIWLVDITKHWVLNDHLVILIIWNKSNSLTMLC